MSEPRFILSKKRALEQYEIVRDLADEVSYSSKTNPLVGEILEEETDSFFSIHSNYELENVGDKSRVVFLAQGWSSEEFKDLVSRGIKFFVVDNFQDLETLKCSLRGDEEINLFLRLKLKENTLRTEKHFVFGFSSDFINKNISNLKNVRGISSIGIHFHRKTQNVAEWDLVREIEGVLKREVLENLDYVIMGGGLPSVYANTNVKVFEGIYSKIKDFKNFVNSLGAKLVIEPGRFVCASAIKLETNVRAVYDNNVVVDASVYNSDLDALIVPVKLLVDGELERGEGECYSIKGITPCSMDLFRYRVYLPEVRVGDKITFLNAGAYNFTTDFCSLPKIKTIIVD